MPKQITSEEFRSVIGDDLFQKCIEKFRGRQFYFGKKSNLLNFKNNEQRNEFIYNACINSGCSYETVADRLNLSTDYVRRICYDMIKVKNRTIATGSNK